MKRLLKILTVLGAVLLCAWLLFAVPAEEKRLEDFSCPTDNHAYFSLPRSGPNFSVYSFLGHGLGRTYLKGAAWAVVLAAYRELAVSCPSLRFIYAETGSKGGGRFWPHRTHREGLSADFITPVLRAKSAGGEEPAMLPCGVTSLWGYGIRLDARGRWGDYRLDAAALIAHLEALARLAPRYGLIVRRVILEPPLLVLLRREPGFTRIASLSFMGARPGSPTTGITMWILCGANSGGCARSRLFYGAKLRRTP